MLDTDKSFNLVFRSIGFEQPVLFGAVFKQRALPTTLFVNAKGRLVSTRVGELSSATLSERLLTPAR